MRDVERENFAREFALYVQYGRSTLHAIEQMRSAIEDIHDQFFDISQEIEKCDSLLKEIDHNESLFRNGLMRIGDPSCVIGELVDDGDVDWTEKISCDGERCYVYYILNEDKDKVKIGISSNPIKRAKQLQTASGEDIEIINVIEFPERKQAKEAESFLHRTFSNWRRKPSKVARSCEWFDSTIVELLEKRFWTYEQLRLEIGDCWEAYQSTAKEISEKMKMVQ